MSRSDERARHPVERLRNSAWRRARSAAGLPGLQVHDLRRTFVTRLREGGVSKWMVSACLGHKDGGVTELYALPTLRELRAAVETLEETGSSALAAIQLSHFSVGARPSGSRNVRK